MSSSARCSLGIFTRLYSEVHLYFTSEEHNFYCFSMLSKKLFIIRWATSENSWFNVLLFVHCCNFVRSHCLNFYRDVTLYYFGCEVYNVWCFWMEWKKNCVNYIFPHIYRVSDCIIFTLYYLWNWRFRLNFSAKFHGRRLHLRACSIEKQS